MNKDLITLNEVQNDGKTIHLYYNREVGLYEAFGFSAYFVSELADVMVSFTEELMMPVALIKKQDVKKLVEGLSKQQEEYSDYYRLILTDEMSLDDYDKWVESVK